jgi:hypothetical protein
MLFFVFMIFAKLAESLESYMERLRDDMLAGKYEYMDEDMGLMVSTNTPDCLPCRIFSPDLLLKCEHL